MFALQALERGDLTPAPAGARPELAWIPLSKLVIDRAYQRRMAERSRRMIARGVEEFSWRRLKALNVVALADGRFAILDGQHTAVILLTHGGIAEAPCLVCPDQGQAKAAADFVALNTGRVQMTAQQKYRAALAAGDEHALAVEAAANAAGVTILPAPPQKGLYRAGQTVAVTELRNLAAKRGEAGLTRILTAAKGAALTPISTDILRAIDVLLFDDAYAGDVTVDEIAARLRARREDIEDVADLARLDTGAPRYRELAVAIYRSSP